MAEKYEFTLKFENTTIKVMLGEEEARNFARLMGMPWPAAFARQGNVSYEVISKN